MRYSFTIPHDGYNWSYTLLPYGDYQSIDLEGVVFMQIFKVHDHRYDLQAFFYRTKTIFSCQSYCTKKELYGAIQKLLQDKL